MIKHRSEPRTLSNEFRDQYNINKLHCKHAVWKMQTSPPREIAKLVKRFFKKTKTQTFRVYDPSVLGKTRLRKTNRHTNDRSTCACNSSDKMYIIMFIGNAHS